MSADTHTYQTHLDGHPVSLEDLKPLAFAGFAHFTAMQVRKGQVRGLDLHLARLQTASEGLFANSVPKERMRAYLRAAVDGGPDKQSAIVTLFSRSGEFTAAGFGKEPAVLVRTGPASDGPEGPLRLASVVHERALPSIKHVGESAKTYYLQQAAQQGFDDAIFMNRDRRLSEATIWNLAFWDGDAVVWPEAPMLLGTTMSILQRQLDRFGIRQRQQEITLDHLESFAGAVVMNSWTPGVAVTAIDSTGIPEASRFMELLHQAYHAEPTVSL